MLKPEIIKLCGEIQALGVFVSDISEHDVFVNYSGHVNLLEVTVINDGWTEDCDRTKFEAYLDGEDLDEKLMHIKKELESLLSEIYSLSELEVEKE